MGYKAVRTDRHKYIQYTDLDGMDELYDLETDPYEMENLIDQADRAALLDELQAELARLLAATQ
jgi:N-acetylglucosamine-6-sulfatase